MIHINQDPNDPNADKFITPLVMRLDSNTDHPVFAVSGIVILDHQGDTNQANRWNHEDISIHPTIPAPNNHFFVVDEGVGLITLNAVGNWQHSVYAGWAVDSTYIPNGGTLRIEAHVATRDTDGTLHRVGYYATVRGHFQEQPPIG